MTRIGNSAFSGCSSLTSINIPESVTEIESYVFYNCSSLSSIDIPESVITIGDSTFSGCKALTSIDIPDSVISIGKGAFENCTNLTSVILPSRITKIEDSTFSSCYNLSNIIIPDSVTAIGDSAFNNCNLREVTISDSVKSIESNAFSYKGWTTCYTVPHSYASTYFSKVVYLCDEPEVPETHYIAFPTSTIVMPAEDFIQLADYLITDLTISDCSVQISNENICEYDISDGSITSWEEGVCDITVSYGDYNASASIIVENDTPSTLESIQFCSDTLEMKKGEITVNTILLTPQNADPSSIVWSSSDESVVNVENGKITAIKPGTATITACSSVNSSITAECTVTVTAPLFDIIPFEESLTMKVGSNKKLSFYKYPSDSTDVISFISDNTSVAEVDEEGLVTAIGAGSANITISSGNIIKIIPVTVTRELLGITINPDKVQLSNIGDTVQLEVIYDPVDATYKEVIWSSDRETVATVDQNGLVTTCGRGIAHITATSNNGLTATCTITSKGHNHTWDEGVIITEPTCMEQGEMIFTCLECGETRTEVIEVLAHDFAEWVVTKEATTTEEGEEERTCNLCGFIETRSIEKLPAATIGDNSYASLQEAVEAAQEGDVIRLEANVEENLKISSDQVITIDLNGYSIVSENEAEAINNTGTLIIKNSGVSEETNESQESGGIRFIRKLLGAKDAVEINGAGVISADCAEDIAIYNRGSLTIESGIIIGAIVCTGSSSTLTITGGTINGAVAAFNPSGVTITGGTFKYDPSAYLDSDHMAVNDGDVYTIANVVRVTVRSMEQSSLAEVATVSGGGAYAEGSEVTVKANAVTGYDFVGWFVKDGEGFSGEVLSTNTTYTFTANAGTDLAAVYKVSTVNTKAELQVYGSEFRVNGGPVQMTYFYSQKFDLNTTITLEATGTDFLYWMNSSKKIISRDAATSFVLARDTSVTAVYKRSGESSAFVEFVSDYGQIMQAQNYEAESEIEMPAGPAKPGYEFTGWDKTADEIRAAIAEGTKYIEVKPVYEKLNNIYRLTLVYDGEAEEPEQLAGDRNYTLTAKEIEGRKFAYWQDDWGNKLSTSETYKYFLSRNVTITAVYVNEEETVAKEPLIAVTDAKGIVVDGKNKISYTIIRDVPEGYTLVRNGIILSTLEMYGEEGGADRLVLGGEGVTERTSTNNNRNDYLNYNRTVNNDTDMRIYLKGYMIVQNDETGVTETIYSDIINKTYNEVK